MFEKTIPIEEIMKLSFSPAWDSSKLPLTEWFESFKKTISDPAIGFFNVTDRSELLNSCKDIYSKFKNKKCFVQVGIGGSSLGPEMLVSALQKNDCKFQFINNIDPDMIHDQLSGINIEETLFYFVSKSGGTAETMAGFSIVSNLLLEKGIKESDLKNYYVFATDPLKSELLDLGAELGVDCLEIPSNVGGRFSVLTPVGFLPALFAGLDCDALLKGANNLKKDLLNEDLANNTLLETASFLMNQKSLGKNQTVIMPYSSKLRDLGFWFVQLWAESLGKKLSLNGDTVFEGLTPIPGYGATDQHSQVQLFMEGPQDKVMIMLQVNKFDNDYSLKNSFNASRLKMLSSHSLSDLMEAEFRGSLMALKEQERPYIHLEIPRNNEESLGEMILFFESLTAIMGSALNIDPFDQPGVELGKIYAFARLEERNH
ncbi:MAG: glucose-6-phosphate isomerase [Bacteriovoracaceae bacterium]